MTAVSTVITRVQNAAQDAGAVRWAQSEIIDWINDAMREISNVDPDSNAQLTNVTLVAGTKQSLPAGAIALIRVVRNMGTGAVPGEAPREVNRELMDRHLPTWHAATAAVIVKNYMRDERVPRNFYVYPPMSGTTSVVECEYSAVPTLITAPSDTLPLSDHYVPPIVDYVLWRMFSKDIEIPGMLSKAAERRKAFDAYLQGTDKGQSEDA